MLMHAQLRRSRLKIIFEWRESPTSTCAGKISVGDTTLTAQAWLQSHVFLLSYFKVSARVKNGEFSIFLISRR